MFVLKKILVLFTIFIGLLVPSQVVDAMEKSNHQEVGFDIQALIPDNQVNRKNSYFDLRMKPKQKQTLQIIVNNTSDQDSTYKIAVNQAYTNSQGLIDYQKSVQPDQSMPYQINKLIKYPKQINVPANSTNVFRLQLLMPAAKYRGQILAGIHVSKAVKGTSETTAAFGYILGLKLTERDQKVKRDLKLLDVKSTVVAGKPSIVAVMQNPKMDAYGHLNYQTKILKRGTETVVQKQVETNRQMAPNSNYHKIVGIDQHLKSGDYTLDIVVSDAQNHRWHFKRNFTITAKQSDGINNIVVNQDQKKFNWWFYLLAGLLVMMITLLIVVILKRYIVKHNQK